MVKEGILTRREMDVIKKKLKNQKLNQQDSNYLSKYVRPKLKKIALLNAEALLDRLRYNQKAIPIENKVKKIILEQIKNVCAIIIYGSVIQKSYNNYNDIDILIVIKNKTWKTTSEKYKIISLLVEKARKRDLSLDVQIIDKSSFYFQYSRNPSLIYQLKDYKLIYGRIKIPRGIELSKMDLRMKLDWSDIADETSDGNEIYYAIRNVILVRLLHKGIVDNNLLHRKVVEQLGINLLMNLKNCAASETEKRIALHYLRKLIEMTRKEIINSKWEKMTLSNH